MPNFVDLYTSSVRHKDVSKLALIPDSFLDDFEREARSWLVEYSDKFGAVPSAKIVEKEPVAQPCFFRSSIYTAEPIQAVYAGAMEWLVERFIRRQLAEIEETANGHYPVHQLLAVAKTAASISSMEHATFLKMDRDSLYSQKVLESGVPWGFSYLDEITGGILPGEVALIGARTGVGKSLVVCRQAVKWAQAGKRVMVVSAEMPPEQLTYRMDAMLGGFNPHLFRDKSAREKLAEKRETVEFELGVIHDIGGDVLFPRDRQLTVESLVASCHDQSPDVLVVDGVYLLQPAGKSLSASWERTKAASNAIKQLAMDLNIPVMTTSQFKRTGKADGFDLEDIAYSDALSQDSDLVLALTREPSSNRVQCDVIKNRSGEVGGTFQFDMRWENSTVVEVPWTRATISLGVAAS